MIHDICNLLWLRVQTLFMSTNFSLFFLCNKGICYFLCAAVLSVLALQSWLKSKIYSCDSCVKKNLFFSHIGTSKIRQSLLKMLCCYLDKWVWLLKFNEHVCRRYSEVSQTFSIRQKAKQNIKRNFVLKLLEAVFLFLFAYENSWGISTIQFCIVMQYKRRAHTLWKLKISSRVALEVSESFQFDCKFENISSILKQKV